MRDVKEIEILEYRQSLIDLLNLKVSDKVINILEFNSIKNNLKVTNYLLATYRKMSIRNQTYLIG